MKKIKSYESFETVEEWIEEPNEIITDLIYIWTIGSKWFSISSKPIDGKELIKF